MNGVSKTELFQCLGYGGPRDLIEALLQDAQLSRPAKINIAERKIPQVEAIIGAAFLLVCNRGDCGTRAAKQRDDRTVVPAATSDFCEVCSGSNTQRVVDEMVAAFQDAGWRQLCVVGGSKSTRRELTKAVAGRLELRLIPGDQRRTKADAAPDLHWADHVVIWGGTRLDHTVSNLYQGRNVSAVNKRSVQVVAEKAIVMAKRHRK